MKKFYFLIYFGLLIGAYAFSQSQGVHLFNDKQPLSLNSTRIDFDSLNIEYKSSWGFGQSFSIASDGTGTYKFIGSGAGVIILDVSNPENPVKVSEFSTRGLVDQIFYDENSNRLYVTAYFAGFEIWDISNIESPMKIGGSAVDGLPRGGIYAEGDFVYIVTVADGLQVFNVSTPSMPVNVGYCLIDPVNLCWTSHKSGNYIYAALYEGGMVIIDISNPANPYITGAYYDVVYGVSVINEMAIVVSYSYGLNILDVSDPTNIVLKGTCLLPEFPYRVAVNGDYAYVANASSNGGGINVVNITDITQPALITTYQGYAEYLASGGNVLAFTGGSYPCTILNISTPAAPTFASSYSMPVFTSDIHVAGNFAYTGNNGLRVFDISDQNNPIQVGYNPIDGSIVRTTGNKAVYIRESMTSNNPVMMIDIADPTNPIFLGQYNSPVMTNDLEIKDHYAVVSCWWDGIRIIDFTNPANPVLVAHKMGWTSGGTAGVTYCYSQAIDIEGNYLYIIDYGPFGEEDTKGLYILDISDITNPVLIKRFAELQSYGYDLDAVGDYVYIADNFGGVEVIDVTDKNNPIIRGYVTLPDGANSIRVKEDNAFVADYINGGVQAVDVSDPSNPFISGYYRRTGCFALGVDVSGKNIYVADGAAGFQIYHTSLITGSKALTQYKTDYTRSYPNPFNDNVTIVIKKSFNPGLNLTIHDASGHKIATLLPEELLEGETKYRWNGRTSMGNQVKPGIYFYYSATGDIYGKIIKAK